MDELVRWLGEQLDAEEAEARLTADAFGVVWTNDDAMESVRSDTGADVVEEPYTPRSFIAAHDPARVLREIAAKRQIFELHAPSDLGTWVGDDDDKQPACRTCGNLTVRFPCATLRLLALPYADRPGYEERWAP